MMSGDGEVKIFVRVDHLEEAVANKPKEPLVWKRL